jgi:uncharacterized protein YidB (DUF937 family)
MEGAARAIEGRAGAAGGGHGLPDIVEFLRLAGLGDVDNDWVWQSGLIEWRGGGPDWHH